MWERIDAYLEFAFDCIQVGFFLSVGFWLFMELLEAIGEYCRHVQDKIYQRKKKP